MSFFIFVMLCVISCFISTFQPEKMADILQITLLNAFSVMKTFLILVLVSLQFVSKGPINIESPLDYVKGCA